jgi:hypothetical protein
MTGNLPESKAFKMSILGWDSAFRIAFPSGSRSAVDLKIKGAAGENYFTKNPLSLHFEGEGTGVRVRA